MKSKQKILVPVDFSHSCIELVNFAKEWAKPDGEIHLLFVNELFDMPFGESTFPYGLSNFKEIDESIHKWAEEEFDKLKKNTDLPNLNLTIQSGNVAKTIVAYAETHHIDLLMMATHTKGTVEALFLGSKTSRVLHLTKIPMIVMREPKKSLQFPPRHILVTTDFSKTSQSVFAEVAAIAKTHQSKVTILSIDSYEGNFLEKINAYQREHFFDAFRELGDLVEVKQERSVRADEGILQFLKRNAEIDLLAMSSHGRSGLSHILLGSTTESVIRQVNIPVMVVRAFN